MLYDCVTWIPCACHYDMLCRVHHKFLTRCIGWRKHNRADHPISYLDTLIKTGSESIEATLRRRRIFFAGFFVARMEDTRLPKCVMFGELVGGAGCVGGQEKEWMGCFLDDLSPFGINADQWTTAAQDEGEWRRTAEQGTKHFMAKWIAAEKAKAGLYGMQWYAPTWREGPRRGWPKASGLVLVRSPLLTSHKWRELVCILRGFGLQMMSWRLFLVWRLFCFLLRFLSLCFLSLKPRPSVQSSFDTSAGAPIVTNDFFTFFIFVHLEVSLFPSIFCTIAAFSLYGEYVVRPFLPNNGVFLPCDHGLDFLH